LPTTFFLGGTDLTRIDFKGLFLAFLLGILSAGCAAQSSQPQFVIAKGAWSGGWLADGSQLLIHTVKHDIFIVSTSNPTFPRVDTSWDFSQVLKESGLLWSPDGMSILYTKAEGGKGLDLYLINAPGQAPSIILSSIISLIGPRWLPDGQHFSVVIDDTFRVFDRDGRNYRDLPIATSQMFDFAWSPNGKQIAFSDFTHTYIVEANTGRPVDTGGFPRECIQPTWSPDGLYIACIENTLRLQGNLVIAKLDGKQRIKLAGVEELSAEQFDPDEFLYTEPLWSPRGDYISTRRIRADIHDFLDPGHYEVVLIPVPDLK
jgi:Tol biopolymer transport system component